MATGGEPDFNGQHLADMLPPRGVRAHGADDQSAVIGPKRQLVIDRVLASRRLGAGAQRGHAPSGGTSCLPEGLLADPERVGACGVSFGGWTTLALNSIDQRPKASFPIVPAWGKGPVKTESLQALVRLDDWGRPSDFVLAPSAMR